MRSLLEGAGSYYDPLDKKQVDEMVMKIAKSKLLTHDEHQNKYSCCKQIYMGKFIIIF